MDIIFYISACGGMAFQLAGLLVWGDKPRRYVQDHGGKTTLFLYTGAGLRDYVEARRISKRVGRKPTFLTR